jgi:ferredoxin--NADP+ reductase
VLDAADHQHVQRDLAQVGSGREHALVRAKLEILSKLGDAGAPSPRPRIRLTYHLTPHRIDGSQRVEAIEFRRTGTAEMCRMDAGLVLTSIGYRGKPIADLPFDDAAWLVPNDRGRVIDPADGAPVGAAYVAGWIKRGPTGFIGTNKSCALQTVQQLVADFNLGLLPEPVHRSGALAKLVRARRPDVVDAAGWRAIDAAEIARGVADGRPRNKFTVVADMLAVAASAPKPTVRERILAGIRG